MKYSDYLMVQHAAARGPVLVTRPDRVTLATLVAWMPNRRGRHENTARVEFPNGARMTVPTSAVSLPAVERSFL